MKQKYFTDNGRKFLLMEEPRESNPNKVKAVLLEKMSDGSFEKINVWKSGADAAKLSAAASGISQRAYSKLEAFKKGIEREEKQALSE